MGRLGSTSVRVVRAGRWEENQGGAAQSRKRTSHLGSEDLGFQNLSSLYLSCVTLTFLSLGGLLCVKEIIIAPLHSQCDYGTTRVCACAHV